MRSIPVVLLVVAMTLAACGSSGDDAARSDPVTADVPRMESSGGWLGGAPPDESVERTTGGDTSSSGVAVAAAETAMEESGDVEGDTTDRPADADDGTGAESTSSRPTTTAGALRGGSVDDNVDFADYLDYRERFSTTGILVHDLDVSERHVIVVRDPDGRPVLGATVAVRDGERVVATRTTYADGIARFHPLAVDPQAEGVASYLAEVELGEARATIELPRGSATHTVELAADPIVAPVPLDVHFLLDATGSMGDELDRLRETIASVAERVAALDGSPSLRLGMTAYRDRGEAYVTRTFDFTDDVSAFRVALDDVVADGGGDEPEDVNAAVHAALEDPTWRDGRAVRLVFLVADAGPHLDYSDGPDYADDVLVAAERGIRIVPLASSGLDDQGEYVFRQLAQVTGAPFLFQTYGADGAPGDDTPHDVAGYDVLALDDLVVQVVEDELTRLAGADVVPPQQ